MAEQLGGPRSARDRILETAAHLFYEQGIRAVGIDTIIAASGVAKMTLYHHFPSKEKLVVAYLERTHAQFWDWLEGLIAPHADDPRRALEAIFEGLATLATSPACLGCAFLGTAVEFPQLSHPGHEQALAHKRAVLDRFQELARAAGAREPQALAESLLLLMDGAWGASRMFGPGSHAAQAAAAARVLIDAQIG